LLVSTFKGEGRARDGMEYVRAEEGAFGSGVFGLVDQQASFQAFFK
jgi:hypothetical protein